MDCRRPPFPQKHNGGSNSQVLPLCRRRDAAYSVRAQSLTHSDAVFSTKSGLLALGLSQRLSSPTSGPFALNLSQRPFSPLPGSVKGAMQWSIQFLMQKDLLRLNVWDNQCSLHCSYIIWLSCGWIQDLQLVTC